MPNRCGYIYCKTNNQEGKCSNIEQILKDCPLSRLVQVQSEKLYNQFKLSASELQNLILKTKNKKEKREF